MAVAALVAAVVGIGIGAAGGRAHGEPQLDAVIVGDSLTGGNASYIAPTLARNGLRVRLEGLSARRIGVSFHFRGYRDSGIERVRLLQAEGVEASLWVIQLGTNDLRSVAQCGCPDPVEFAGALVDELLDLLGPDTATAWVTVVDRSRWDTTQAFNEALARRASMLPNLALMRWGQLATPHPEWFEDHVHPTPRGLVAFTQMYVDGIRKLLDHHAPSGSTGNGLLQARRLGPG